MSEQEWTKDDEKDEQFIMRHNRRVGVDDTGLKVVRSRSDGSAGEVYFDCPWWDVKKNPNNPKFEYAKQCPLDGRETCSAKPCRMKRLVKR